MNTRIVDGRRLGFERMLNRLQRISKGVSQNWILPVIPYHQWSCQLKKKKKTVTSVVFGSPVVARGFHGYCLMSSNHLPYIIDVTNITNIRSQVYEPEMQKRLASWSGSNAPVGRACRYSDRPLASNWKTLTPTSTSTSVPSWNSASLSIDSRDISWKTRVFTLKCRRFG